MNPTTEQKQQAYPQPQQYNQPPPAYNTQYGCPYPISLIPQIPQYPQVPQIPQIPQYQYQQAPQTLQMVPVVQQLGQPCLHYNQLTSYDACALTCIIILCIEFFPFGLFALFCIGAIKHRKCSNCGYEVHSNTAGVYVSFVILQFVFCGYIGLYAYVYLYEQGNGSKNHGQQHYRPRNLY